MSESGVLWLVATPIGCLEDITLRGLRLLKEADLILAEDTRRTRVLCSHHGIVTRLESFHAHSAESKVATIVDRLRGGARIALVTDAGMPLISDPGSPLVVAAVAVGVRVESVPGPSAVTSAVAVSGLRIDTFRFAGFLPRSGAARRQAVAAIRDAADATVFFESPHRLSKTLSELAEVLEGGRRAAVCRELTKVHEEVARGTLAELRDHFAEGVRGEVTVVVEGADRASQAALPDDEEVASMVANLANEGMSARDIAHHLAQTTALSKRDAYQRVIALPQDSLARK